MAYFDNLSSNAQNLIMLNFEFFGKKILLVVTLIFSLYFLFVYWKRKEDTPYLFVGILRIVLFICSLAFITMSPLMIFFLYPQVALDRILMFMLVFYSVLGFVVGVIVLFNVVYYGTTIIAKFAGHTPDPNTKKVFDNIFTQTIKLMGLKRFLKDGK